MIQSFGEYEEGLAASDSFAAFFAGPISLRLRDNLVARLDTIDVLSLDIFDTVLLRDEKSELERFHDIAVRFAGLSEVRAVFPALSSRTALTARLNCARTAYQMGERVEGTTEGRLDQIAALMMQVLRAPAERRVALADIWCATELAVEGEQLRASTFALDLARIANAAGKRVILVTDMYLDEEQVRMLLAQCGADPRQFHAISSSADTIVNKRSGTIFPYLNSKLSMVPDRVLHLGDSYVSDYLQPCLAGWQAQHLPLPRKTIDARIASHELICETQFGARNFQLPINKPGH